MSAVRRFAVAGLEVALRGEASDAFDHMAGHYDRYPPGDGPVDLVIEIERRAGFAGSRARGPEYPAFSRRAVDGGVRFERFDAAGELDHPARRARFVVGDSPNSLEAAIRIAVASALPRVGALILHASGVEAGGRAQLFAGESGAGKSTIAALLADSGAAAAISDELVIARVTGDAAEAVVAPFIGSTGLPHGASFPLGAIHLLRQAPGHALRPLDRPAAFRGLLRHVVSFASTPEAIDQVMALAERLVASVAVDELSFAPRADVAAAIGLT